VYGPSRVPGFRTIGCGADSIAYRREVMLGECTEMHWRRCVERSAVGSRDRDYNAAMVTGPPA